MCKATTLSLAQFAGHNKPWFVLHAVLFFPKGSKARSLSFCYVKCRNCALFHSNKSQLISKEQTLANHCGFSGVNQNMDSGFRRNYKPVIVCPQPPTFQEEKQSRRAVTWEHCHWRGQLYPMAVKKPPLIKYSLNAPLQALRSRCKIICSWGYLLTTEVILCG